MYILTYMFIYTLNNSCEYPLSIWLKHTAFAVCRAVMEADFLSQRLETDIRHCDLDLWLRPKTLTIAECHTRRFGLVSPTDGCRLSIKMTIHLHLYTVEKIMSK